MTKKILLLVLFLPLILMVSLFTTTDVVSLAIDIPVTGIEIVEDNIVYLDLDTNEKYHIDYTVYPTNATKQDVEMSTEVVGEERLAKVEFVDGYLIPKSVGMAKVYLTTIDGGFKDSFIVQIESNMLQEIECYISKSEIYVGDKSIITTEFIPSNAQNQVVSYKSSNENVAVVDNRGNVTGIGRGEAIITIYSVTDKSIFDTVKVKVYNTNIMDVSPNEIVTWEKEGKFNLSIDSSSKYSLSYEILDEALNKVITNDINLSFGEEDEFGNVSVEYKFSESFVGTYNIKITILTDLGYELSKLVKIEIVDKVTAGFNYENTQSVVQGTTTILNFSVNPSNTDVRYEISVSNDNVDVYEMNGLIICQAKSPGVTTIKVNTFVTNIKDPIESTIELVVTPKVFTINELSKTYGIEGTWTVAREDVSGKLLEYKLNYSYGKEKGERFIENVYYEACDKDGKLSEAVTIDSNGVFKIIDSSFVDDVYFKCIFEYDGCRKESAPIKVKCVGNAVNVTCYEELLTATKAEKAIVLSNDISDFGYTKNGELMDITKTYVEMLTTYDWTYYKNINANQPTVKVLIQFKNDLYGNGYTINAHNIAYGLDSTSKLKDDALFRGPLNFVAVTDSESSAISVKAQDNICFAVHENVDIFNVELKGCNLQATSNGSYNLKDLDYIGTVVEVLGNNVNILYSRITNGRTGVRIFGDINDPNKIINVNISNSILSGAREFILRIGSNSFITGNIDNPSPTLPNNTVKSFPVYPSYYRMNEAQKKDYDKSFIKTFVTVKNSCFRSCGIFAIGMDSHFSGPLLADGSSPEILDGKFAEILGNAWHDLAKTSYGAKLTFDGDVRIYDWKKLDNVDSTTLIDVVGNNTMFNDMVLNLNTMVTKVSENEKFSSIVYKNQNYDNGATYVHGGIAFFGGGKNYSVFEEKNIENSFAQLNGYAIGLVEAGRTELEMAAGSEKFYFLLHDSTTTNFLPKDQDEILSSSEAYKNIYTK